MVAVKDLVDNNFNLNKSVNGKKKSNDSIDTLNDSGFSSKFNIKSYKENMESLNSTNDNSYESKSNENIIKMIQNQMDYYFSRENLANDSFLMSQMDKDLYVSIGILAGFNQVKRITTNINVVTEALKSSSNFEVDDTMTKVRVVQRRRIMLIRGIPSSLKHNEILKLFDLSDFPKIFDLEYAAGDMWYLTFNTESDAQLALKFVRDELVTYKNNPLTACIKAKSVFNKGSKSSFPSTSSEQGVVYQVPMINYNQQHQNSNLFLYGPSAMLTQGHWVPPIYSNQLYYMQNKNIENYHIGSNINNTIHQNSIISNSQYNSYSSNDKKPTSNNGSQYQRGNHKYQSKYFEKEKNSRTNNDMKANDSAKSFPDDNDSRANDDNLESINSQYRNFKTNRNDRRNYRKTDQKFKYNQGNYKKKVNDVNNLPVDMDIKHFPALPSMDYVVESFTNVNISKESSDPVSTYTNQISMINEEKVSTEEQNIFDCEQLSQTKLSYAQVIKQITPEPTPEAPKKLLQVNSNKNATVIVTASRPLTTRIVVKDRSSKEKFKNRKEDIRLKEKCFNDGRTEFVDAT